ncbi:hypothetical protein B0H19DRAFT_1059702 [Mycena capillaripes]|nr:hypothetical protein B0H19DRAFT_1059702 [Mycena capillaripes]
MVQAKGKEEVFRPTYSDLGEHLCVHLPSSTLCTAYSASMPQEVIDLVMKTCQMEPENTVKLLLSTNRPNLIYATIPMIGTINNLTNLNILLPPTFPPGYLFPKGIHVVKLFKADDGDVRILIATEAASNGFDIVNIRFILKLGVPKTMFEDDQHGGRGRCDGLLCLVLTIAKQWALDNLSADLDHKKSKKEERTEQAVIGYTHSKSCRRRQLVSLNHENTLEALQYDKYCCDNCHNFDLAEFLPGVIPTESDSDSDLEQPKKKPKHV